METEINSIIRGHHVYKQVWTPFLGEIVSLHHESENNHDSHAVAIMKDDTVVGHTPRELSRIFSFFLEHDGVIVAEVTGHRRFGNGLEIPCKYRLTGKKNLISRAEKLLCKKLK